MVESFTFKKYTDYKYDRFYCDTIFTDFLDDWTQYTNISEFQFYFKKQLPMIFKKKPSL